MPTLVCFLAPRSSRPRIDLRVLVGSWYAASNHHPIWDYPALGDDDYSVANIIVRVIYFIGFARRGNDHVISNTRIFIYYGIFNPAVAPDTDSRLARFFVLHDRIQRFIKIT